MPRPNKIDIEKLYEMRTKEKKTAKECAVFFGCSSAAICHAEKKISTNVARVTALEMGHNILKRELDVVDQLFETNKHVKDILDGLMEKIRKGNTRNKEDSKDLREIAIKAAAEIRQQLNFQVEIFKILNDAKVVAEFQRVALEVIGKLQPQARNDIIAALKEAKALRSSVVI